MVDDLFKARRGCNNLVEFGEIKSSFQISTKIINFSFLII